MATWTSTAPPTLDETKVAKVQQIKDEAYRLLLPSDWYVIRQQETGEMIPQTIRDYRQAVRDASDQAEADVLALGTVEEVLAYQVTWPKPPKSG